MRKTRRSARKQTPLSAQEALQLLESAIGYCQVAGLDVKAQNGDNGTLRLLISNAHYILIDNGTRAAFRFGNLPNLTAQAESIGAQAGKE